MRLDSHRLEQGGAPCSLAYYRAFPSGDLRALIRAGRTLFRWIWPQVHGAITGKLTGVADPNRKRSEGDHLDALFSLITARSRQREPFKVIFGLYLFVIVAGMLIHLYASRKPRTRDRLIEVALLYLLVIGAGVSGIVAFVSHAFEADSTARSIGWPAGSPFQLEVAFADLSYGLLGLICIKVPGPFWLATGVATSVFLLGCNYGHLYQAFAKNNYAPNNYGLINLFEIIWPAAVLILLIPYMRTWTRQHAAHVQYGCTPTYPYS
jgi:hypothetical protein